MQSHVGVIPMELFISFSINYISIASKSKAQISAGAILQICWGHFFTITMVKVELWTTISEELRKNVQRS